MQCNELPPGRLTNLTVRCTLTVLNGVPGDEVVQVYHSAGADVRKNIKDHPVPQRSLVDFARVRCETGTAAASTNVEFTLSSDMARLVDATGEKRLYPGTHNFIFSRGHGTEFEFPVKF